MRGLALAALGGILFYGCAAESKIWETEGHVLEESTNQVLIDHEEIPGLMPAMQMPFEADAKILGQLEVGDEIKFRFEQHGSKFVVTEITGMRRPVQAPGAPLDPGAPRKAGHFAFDLIDQNNRPVKFADFKGRVLLVNFIYTRCPGPCPAQTAQLAAMKNSLPPDVKDEIAMVSITLDPTYDNPARLKAFAARQKADWPFLSGAPENVNAVKAGYLIESGPGKSQPIDHWVGVYMFNREGVLIRRFSGLDEDMRQVADFATQIASAPR
jgi:protein SCO1